MNGREGGGAARGGAEPGGRKVAEGSAALAHREDSLARREAALAKELESVGGTRQRLERALEEASGMSASRAKQLLLQEVEEQARHDAARRIRQIQEQTNRNAHRPLPNILPLP